MGSNDDWRRIIALSLDWEQAHAKLESVVDKLRPELRGRRPEGLPHSVWELVEHIRRTQHDLLQFCVEAHYHEPKWPDDYWPEARAPESDADWNKSLADIRRDTTLLAEFTMESGKDLTAKVPHGTGQTYLRTILVAVDHTAHHVGQIIDVRRLLGAWPPA